MEKYWETRRAKAAPTALPGLSEVERALAEASATEARPAPHGGDPATPASAQTIAPDDGADDPWLGWSW